MKSEHVVGTISFRTLIADLDKHREGKDYFEPIPSLRDTVLRVVTETEMDAGPEMVALDIGSDGKGSPTIRVYLTKDQAVALCGLIGHAVHN